MKNSELPKLRLDTELYNKIKKTIDSLNKNESGIKFSMIEFRTMALKHFCEDIIANGLNLNFKMG